MKPSIVCLFALAFSATSAHCVILYSGIKNIVIPNSFSSVYINVDDLAGSGSSVQQSGWDIDTFFGGEAFGNSTNFQPARSSFANNSPIINLTAGSLVDNSLVYFNNVAGSSMHIGTDPNQFTSGSEGFIGFTLVDNASNGPYFGWMRVNFSNTGGQGVIIDWAFNNSGTPIVVGAVPEPTTLGLFMLAVSLLTTRRKR